jgi:hypothetical protein
LWMSSILPGLYFQPFHTLTYRGDCDGDVEPTLRGIPP